MKTNRTYIAIAGALLLALVAIVFVYTSPTSSPAQPARQEKTQSSTVSLTIGGLYESKQIEITSDETVLRVLQTLDAQDPELQLSTKEYSGLGTLVDGMHGNKNGSDKKYWQYNVNGVMPQIGADAYKLKNGDAIEWFFSPSQE